VHSQLSWRCHLTHDKATVSRTFVTTDLDLSRKENAVVVRLLSGTQPIAADDESIDSTAHLITGSFSTRVVCFDMPWFVIAC
jgi:hypothetical protein